MSPEPDGPDEPSLPPDDLSALSEAELARLAAAIWARVVGSEPGDDADGG